MPPAARPVTPHMSGLVPDRQCRKGTEQRYTISPLSRSRSIVGMYMALTKSVAWTCDSKIPPPHRKTPRRIDSREIRSGMGCAPPKPADASGRVCLLSRASGPSAVRHRTRFSSSGVQGPVYQPAMQPLPGMPYHQGVMPSFMAPNGPPMNQAGRSYSHNAWCLRSGSERTICDLNQVSRSHSHRAPTYRHVVHGSKRTTDEPSRQKLLTQCPVHDAAIRRHAHDDTFALGKVMGSRKDCPVYGLLDGCSRARLRRRLSGVRGSFVV
ncbi:hypothetical protein F4780DRAFT_719207 [Xylariomycetidae sp. FL0641]|nr:hypothetical protein F4780DRAFT_719207 [Xylariomycetidae sp. FL0641]